MQYLRIIKSAIFVSLLEKEKYEAEPGKYLVGFVRWWQLLALLLDINGHFPKITLRKVLGVWLTLISTRIVRSFTASAYNVNLCLIDTIHNGERSTTSVGVSHHVSWRSPPRQRGTSAATCLEQWWVHSPPQLLSSADCTELGGAREIFIFRLWLMLFWSLLLFKSLTFCLLYWNTEELTSDSFLTPCTAHSFSHCVLSLLFWCLSWC